MEAKFGITYLGGKNSIAADIVSCLPAATHFIDLFCGGCGITHAAILSGKYKAFTVNDIDSGMPKLFRDAIMGKYQNENRWISRSDFIKNKDKDAYIRTCWSFGNNKNNYLYNKEIEPWKRAMHAVLLFDDFSFFDAMGIDFGTRTAGGDRYFFKKRVTQTHLDAYKRWILSHMFPLKGGAFNASLKNLKNMQSLERLQRLQSLERLQRLQSLERLQRLDVVKRLNILGKSYDQVQIPDDSVVYCDPPYRGCAGYGLEFDHDKFYRWCQTRSFPVFVSEYNMPQGFSPIYELPKKQLYSGGTGKLVIEKLFVQERFANQYKRSLF